MNTDIYHHNNITAKFCHGSFLEILKHKLRQILEL